MSNEEESDSIYALTDAELEAARLLFTAIHHGEVDVVRLRTLKGPVDVVLCVRIPTETESGTVLLPLARLFRASEDVHAQYDMSTSGIVPLPLSLGELKDVDQAQIDELVERARQS